ncbi:hypothetical protein BDQ17DRAFT_914463 [Cyathus striatus]|nr:hypothetical protein BDQ17DRAFT_914463 [Cyathus striatus]
MKSCTFVLLFFSLGSYCHLVSNSRALSILLSMDIQAWSRTGRRNHVHLFCYSLSNPKFSLYLQTFTTTELVVYIIAERFEYPQACILSMDIGAWNNAHSFLLLAFKSLIEVIIFVAQLLQCLVDSTIPQTPLATFTVFSSLVSTVSVLQRFLYQSLSPTIYKLLHRNRSSFHVRPGYPSLRRFYLHACGPPAQPLQPQRSYDILLYLVQFYHPKILLYLVQILHLPEHPALSIRQVSSKNEDRERHGTASYMTTFARHRHRCRITYRRTYIHRRALRYRHSAEERGDVLHGEYIYVTGGYHRMDS